MPALTLNVVQPSNLNTPDFEIGTRIPNKITMRGSVVVDVTENNAAKTLTFTAADGSTKVISMAALDVYVDAANSFWDATTNVITLKQTNGGADVVFNLGDLQKSTVTSGAGVTLSGDGSDANPLKADAVIDPASSTALSVSAAGLKLDPSALNIAVANGIATTAAGNGSAATPAKFDVVIDPTSSASLTASAAGLKLDTAMLLPVTLTDAFGTVIGMIGMAAPTSHVPAWTQTGTVVAGDAAASDYFGISVSLNAAGNVLAVGSYAQDSAGVNAGKVYLYSVAGGVATQTGTVVAGDAAASDYFGVSVSLNAAGDVLAVGAYAQDSAGVNAGKVYLYSVASGVATQTGTVVAGDAAASDQFGVSVSLNAAGDVLAVGAITQDSAATDAGKVYLYSVAGGVATQTGTVVAGDAAASDYFGRSVSLNAAGDVLAVGAHAQDSAATDAGKVYLYSVAGGVATQTGTVVAGDAAASDYFGVSVSLNAAGDVLAVGAHTQDSAGVNAGKVYLYSVAGGVATQTGTVVAGDAAASDYFGVSVSLNAAGDVLAVGAYAQDSAATDAGKVYSFSLV